MNKMTRAEAGKLGFEKSRETQRRQKESRIKDYYSNPKKCLFCDAPIVYEKKTKTKFCNQSCAAKLNNAIYFKHTTKIKDSLGNKITKIKPLTKPSCLNCGKTVKNYCNKYCNSSCMGKYTRKNNIKQWLDEPSNWKNAPNGAKDYLAEKFGYNCSECGISDWNEKPISLELEHKDGNSENNHPDNLCLICPNCHSQTSTYKARNKGNGRHKRRLRYQEGKSY